MNPMPAPSAARTAVSLRDRLSRLTPEQARRLLGSHGRELLQEGGKYDVPLDHAVLRAGTFRLDLSGAVVTIRQDDSARQRLRLSCSACSPPCVHAGAALALVLEEKLALGLAAPPSERVPLEHLDEDALLRQALADRAERARAERMTVRSADPSRPWTDYVVTSSQSGKSYRVALRGEERGDSYCSCPDFQKNTLGTCKHVLHALEKVRRRFRAAQLRRPYRRTRFSVALRYGSDLTLHLRPPDRVDPGAARLAKPFATVGDAAIPKLLETVAALERRGHEVVIHPDAEEHIERRLLQRRLQRRCAAMRRDPAAHPLRTTLLRSELLPYQLDGIAFAAGVGRAVLADDMGLGKTIQAIGLAELLAREAGIARVLVVCPASVKAQWVREIQRFCDRSAQAVTGPAKSRRAQYGDAFFTVCNYEQVLRDLDDIETVSWDLVVLDEAQRIKNWAAKTTATIKRLRSPFALALTGTPLENRLDELYSLVEFVDARRLGPAFRFFHRHRVVAENGRVQGYKDLDVLRETLAPVLLRRTRAAVAEQLPPRTNQIVRVPPTEEQLAIHDSGVRVITQIVRKPYLSEMDLLRLRKALLLCRMAADSTFLVSKERPAHSSKLERLAELLDDLLASPDRKIVLFSEWTTMLDEVERLLAPRGADFVRLEGKVPQRRRAQLVARFQDDPACRLFLTTNAGATGLNLQAADTVINVDLPWNPAMLEQRIGRAHRMGQRRPVHVFVLVTEGTIEENMLRTLSAKHELYRAVLDPDSELDTVTLESGMEELRRRLETLLGTPEPAPVDRSEQRGTQAQVDRAAHRTRVAAAGGRLFTAAFELLGEMLPEADQRTPDPAAATALRQRLLDCLEPGEDGGLRLSVTLPDRSAVDTLATTLARLLASAAPAE